MKLPICRKLLQEAYELRKAARASRCVFFAFNVETKDYENVDHCKASTALLSMRPEPAALVGLNERGYVLHDSAGSHPGRNPVLSKHEHQLQ